MATEPTDVVATTTATTTKNETSLVTEIASFLKNNPNVHVSDHPILGHKITILRSSITHSGTFRAALKEITYHLGYEATRSLSTTPIQITVPKKSSATGTKNATTVNESTTTTAENGNNNNSNGGFDHDEYVGSKLKEHVALIPILRSGLGMVDSMMELIPTSEIHHIGMYKSSIQDHPVLYYNKLPRHCQADVAYVLDPCIATASTVISVVTMLKKWGVDTIHVVCVIGSLSGLQTLLDVHPDIDITVGTIDDVIDGNLVPGLGDSGDRLYGTTFISDTNEVDESLVHPSKRKRTYSHAE